MKQSKTQTQITQAFHGLMAYSGRNKTIYALVDQCRNINSLSGEICTANKLVGNIGVVVDAIHTVAVNGDVYSGIDEQGNRTFDPSENGNKSWFYDGMIEEKWSYDPKDWTNVNGWSNQCLNRAGKSAQDNGRKYAEFFARKPQIRCFVYTDKATAKQRKQCRVLAKLFSTVAMLISAETTAVAFQD